MDIRDGDDPDLLFAQAAIHNDIPVRYISRLYRVLRLRTRSQNLSIVASEETKENLLKFDAEMYHTVVKLGWERCESITQTIHVKEMIERSRCRTPQSYASSKPGLRRLVLCERSHAKPQL